jgi:glucose-1-phosphate cytidylyltransferase
MKVVLFCGGLGTRLREYSGTLPKPMVSIGGRPIIWHLMKYYVHFGHTEFVLCLGYRGELIKRYFLEQEGRSGDVESMGATHQLTWDAGDLEQWKITFVDTGLNSNIGERLKSVQPYLGDDPVFLANYSDALSDLPLADYLDRFRQEDKIASFVCVSPSQSFHMVSISRDGLVDDIQTLAEAGLWINGGFFAFKREVFDYLKDGEELVREPFRRLIGLRQLAAYRYDGFWQCMDTFKDKQAFDVMEASGETPWQVWQSSKRGRASDA